MATRRGNGLPKPNTEEPKVKPSRSKSAKGSMSKDGDKKSEKKQTKKASTKKSKKAKQPLPDSSIVTTRPNRTNILSNGNVVLNGLELVPEAKAPYRFGGYRRLVEDCLDGKFSEVQLYRKLCREDLWFLTYFILRNPIANDSMGHWVRMCRMIDEGPKNNVLDMWAREHGKTTLLTINNKIRNVLQNPETTIGIFSYTREAAAVFTSGIKQTLEMNDDLKMLFPDILWDVPPHQGVQWNDDGFTVRRKNHQKECTIEPWGLLKGMPTGRHFLEMHFDDISTLDLADSPKEMEKMKDRFDMAMNIGKDGDIVTVTGTPYHYNDVLMYIQGMKKPDGSPEFVVRKVCATDNEQIDGAPVYLSQERLDKLKRNRKFFNSQQLLNPVPSDEVKLHYSMINVIRPDQVPSRLYKVMVIDPAGQKRGDGRRQDAWAMWVVGVDPRIKDHGSFNIYVLDGLIGRFRHEEAMKAAVNLYCKNSGIRILGVEKIGTGTTDIHLSTALRARGHLVNTQNGRMKILNPLKRGKVMRIEGLATPLCDGALFMVDTIGADTRATLREEMERFPAWHDDGLDALTYAYEMLKDPQFVFSMESYSKEAKVEKAYVDPYEERETDTASLSWMGR